MNVNDHALNDFRSDQVALLDELLSSHVAALAAIGVVSLVRVAKDGVRVRASAGAASFERRERLGQQLELAQALADRTEQYAPVPKPRRGKGDDEPPAPGSEFEPKADDSPAAANWRSRMSSEAGREIYKERAATAECFNAQARNRWLQRLPVRGRPKVRCVALLYALAHTPT